MRYTNTVLTVLVCICLVGCGRYGFSEEGVFSAVPVSDSAALVGCAHDVTAGSASSYAMVWHEYPQPGGNQHSLVFAEVTTTGDLTAGPRRIDFIDAEAEQVWLFATADGYIVFYREDDNSMTYALGIAPSGELRNRVEVGYHTDNLNILDNGDGYTLLYTDKGELFWSRTDASGREIESPVLVEVPDGVAADGEPLLSGVTATRGPSGYHLAFEHEWGSNIGYARLGDNGAVIDSWTDSFGSHHGPGICTDGEGRILVTWHDGDQLAEYALEETTGQPMWNGVRNVVEVNRQQLHADHMAGGDGSMAMVWETDVDTVLPQIAFRTLGVSTFDLGDQQASKAQILSNEEFAFSCPRIARGPSHFGITFRGEIDGTQKILLGIRHD